MPPTAKALESDKNYHFAAGVAIGTLGWRLGCGAGLVKEGYDSAYGGTVELADFAYTCAGSGLTAAIGSGKSLLYRADVSLILLDGLSTSHAIHNGAREVGFPKYFIGEYPSDEKIAAFTVLSLGVLEWSESWHPTMRKVFQYGILLTRPYIVLANYNF